MLFWILLAVTAVVAVVWAIAYCMDEGFSYWGARSFLEKAVETLLSLWGIFWRVFVVAFIGCFVTLIVLLITSLFVPENVYDQRDTDLRAMAVNSATNGSFFIGTGTVEDKQVLSFISEQDGAISVEQVFAEDSYIFEDEDDSPYVTTYEWSKSAWWWMPDEGVKSGETYSFHIPANSVVSNYNISVEGN